MSNSSSERKRINLRTLVHELALRDIGCAGVSKLLVCSASASRYYLAELRGAGLVALRKARHDSDACDRNVYTLCADPAAVRHFLDGLTEPAPTTGLRRKDCAQVDRRWRSVDPAGGETGSAARRDPLVAALFGTAKTPDAASPAS
ncbi:hypothetical protein HAV22_25410 [Massilia sp. TW-1]|uniref:ArsR family transcriptional regulator n=1 Tax=Telluria antibiotica TaxID=2717319 RepID=A0ABX0PIG1_9BURK|nr:hypothetical protein [Telluria antibiotica]NIA56967.1 hypothetical protein [Telluria antibiotica]